MKRGRPATLVAAVLLVILIVTGSRRIGPVPPLGPLLDPSHGIWAVARGAELPPEASGRIPGLTGPVRVAYDARGVPHIFAATEDDAIRALGYVVARDRLLQLEVQARSGAGRLTELLGPATLSLDRETRTLGLSDAAERLMADLPRDSAQYRSLVAYTDGVNGWIDAMGPADLPLEYHLLGRRPSRWEPIDAIHLFNRMGLTLAFNDDELVHAAATSAVGAAAADAIFPVNSPIQEPIVPTGASYPRFSWDPVPAPGAVRSQGAGGNTSHVSRPTSHDELGSNNWAVSRRRSATGHALLAGDPHLQLTLPAIWYEVQLTVPGELDVYGVTIPGLPAVIIGFNRDVAWSLTNTEADVMDRYVETVDDDDRPTHYRLDGAERPLRERVERYLGPDGTVLATDTVRFTHRGPLLRAGGGWISLRWTVLESPTGISSLMRAARAESAAQWLAAMADYRAPAQNMLVADRNGHIAVRSTGRFPIRPRDGRGDRLQDGSLSASDWSGYWPVDSYPQAIDPAQGYLATANQQPLDPRLHPRYLGANWYAPWRALRINQLLRADSAVTPTAMAQYQTDPGSPRADALVPPFVNAARGATDDSTRRAGELLAQWDRRYTRDNRRAVLFEHAVRNLTQLLWDELGGKAVPSLAAVVELLPDSSSPWWDDRRTDAVEHRDDLLRSALRAAYSQTLETYGPPEQGGWRWDRIRHANIYHVMRIPALSALGIPMRGGPSTLNPSTGAGEDGASWRMVVELGDQVTGSGTYPGGQSGNPASSRYLDRLPAWTEGKLEPLAFPHAPADLGASITSVLMLEPRR